MFRLCCLALFLAAASRAMEGDVLQTNVMYISGNLPSLDEPVEYTFSTNDHMLMEKDQGVDMPIQVANNVDLPFMGWDSSVWYTDLDGKAIRFNWNKTMPMEVPAPNGVKWTALAPVSFGECWAVSTDGDVYHYIANQWFKMTNNGPFTYISIGNDGVLLAANKDSRKIFMYNYGTSQWEEYSMAQGITADVGDANHMVVVKDMDGSTAKMTNGQWTDIDQKCRRVSVFDVSAFYCTTPAGEAKKFMF